MNKIKNMRKKYPNSELFEELASIEHQRWSDWHLYMVKNLSPENLKKWEWEAETAYKDLPEKLKDSDREQVMRYWKLIH